MTLEEMGARMSSFEFALHKADFERQPWHEARADMRAALIAATMCNIAPNRKRGAPPARVEDFMLFRENQYHEPTTDELDKFLKGGT